MPGHGFWPSDDLAAFEFAANQPRGGAGAIEYRTSMRRRWGQPEPSRRRDRIVLLDPGPAYNALSGDTLVFKPLAAPDPSHPAAPQPPSPPSSS